MNTNNIGVTLKERRKSKKLKLKQVSEVSGVSISHLGRIERGERFPSGRILMRLAKPLGFTEAELLKLAGFLSTDDSDSQMENLKREVKLAVTEALMRIFAKIDSL